MTKSSYLDDPEFNCLQFKPIPEAELAAAWNRQADKFNQWDSLESDEQLAWAQELAVKTHLHRDSVGVAQLSGWNVAELRRLFEHLIKSSRAYDGYCFMTPVELADSMIDAVLTLEAQS